jgi:Rps23 Pro-64 3,4-dihydroxylase Tpa1-like proline 4-hydroxylase
MGIPQKIEDVLGDGKSVFFKWSDALVGDYQKIKDYRDCVDFKIRRDTLKSGDPKADKIAAIHDQITEKLNECLEHYVQTFRMNPLTYMEAINFVKYGPGQHFQVHPDSGPTYHCDVSTVMYLNDDYEGGELMFPHFEYTYKPEYGDIVLFPSNFLYSHAALPVKSGTKYSAVTMFSYNDRTHKDHVNPSGNLRGRSRFL